jgi:hypothetical protein
MKKFNRHCNLDSKLALGLHLSNFMSITKKLCKMSERERERERERKRVKLGYYRKKNKNMSDK